METSQARFNANRTVVEVFIVILLINYGISSIVSAASPNRISFVDDEYPLVEGSVCKFQHNGTLGTCTHSPLCPVASYEYQRFHIRPTTCSFGTKYPSICCFGQTSGLPAFPTLPPSHDWHPSHAARPEPEQPERPELAHPSPSSYPSDSMVSTHYNTQPDAHIDHGYGQQKSSPELRKSSHWCETNYGRDPFPEDYLQSLRDTDSNSTESGEFPHMAAIGWRNGWRTEWKCGGSLISENFVLTAAHCTTSAGMSPNIVRIGDVHLVYDNEPLTFDIEDIIVHPDYHPPDLYNDIALLKLRGRVIKSNTICPACLWQSPDIVSNGLTATGYGVTPHGGPTEMYLLKTTLEICSSDICQRAYGRDASLSYGIRESTQICAGDPHSEIDRCQGDSGGPLQRYQFGEQKRYYVIGITSFGRACASKAPAIYTRVSAYLDWIEEIVWP